LYHGREIHSLPKIEKELRVWLRWINHDLFGEAKTFDEAKKQDNRKYHSVIHWVHQGYLKGFYKI